MALASTVITSARILDGLGGPALQRGAIVIQGDEIVAVGSEGEIDVPTGPDVTVIDVADGKTVMPGLVDVHTHLVLPGDGTHHEEFIKHTDAILLMQAYRNALTHLRSGVTTVADTGARDQVSFELRNAIGMGLVTGPRLVLCGRPITRTGGHCWFFGCEADSPAGVSAAARQLLKEGADFIKVMATGGGTTGTYPLLPALTTEELTAAVDEAHAIGKHAIAHSTATAGTRRVLDAGFDVIFHCHFYEPDGSQRYQDEVARRIADARVFVNPTLWVSGVNIDAVERKREREGLTEQEAARFDVRLPKHQGQYDETARLVQAGVKLVAGSDSGWGLYQFGDLASELREMVSIGMDASEVIVAATSRAAEALGVDGQVGSLVAGKKADIIVVDGDPDEDIAAIRNVDMVMLGGKVVEGDLM
jgi:imidazolonepropionase-like amidohydrolase